MAWQAETTVKAAPEAVFAYVSDMTKHGEWGQHELEVRATSPAPVAAGSTFASTGHMFGVQHETQTVTEYSPGKRFTFDAVGSIGTVRHTFDISGSGAETRLAKSADIVKPSLMARLMRPMIARQTKKGLAEDLRRIKARIEA